MKNARIISVVLGFSVLGFVLGGQSHHADGVAAGALLGPSVKSPSESLCSVHDCPPCVVQIQTGFGQGTGVLLQGKPNESVGRVLTAAHVVREAREIHVIFGGRNGNKYFDGAANGVTYQYTEDWADLAIISGVQIPEYARGCGVTIANTAPEKGDLLTSVGLENLSAIRVHAAPLISRDSYRPVMYLAVTAQHGDSGGPVFNQKGELVGINSAIGGYVETEVQSVEMPNGTFTQWTSREVPATWAVDLSFAGIVKFLN